MSAVLRLGSTTSVLGAFAVVLGSCGSPAVVEMQYDYVVVGSGAGGGPVASRLARRGHSVLLLEAGDDVGNEVAYRMPAMHALATERDDMAWWFFVQHHEDEAIDATDSKHTPEGILYPRGSALGGSTAVNAMVTVLPSAADWDDLASRTGDPAYRASRMNPLYDRVRQWLPVSFADADIGAEDPQVVDFLLGAVDELTDGAPDEDLVLAGRDAADLGALSGLLAGDLNAAFLAGEPEGLFRLPTAAEDGERRGTRELLLDTVEQGHPLTIRTGRFVTRVLWDESTEPPTAIGVEYVGGRVYGAHLGERDEPSEPEQVFVRREVILAAGAYNSPQLLMLSGVGDPEQLDAHDIDVVVPSPGVGRNLQDRYEAAVVAQLDTPLASIVDCTLGTDDEPLDDDPCYQDWLQGEGVYTTNGFAASALVHSDDSALSDLQIFAFPADARGYYPGYALDALATKDHFSWLILKGHTANDDGFVALRSDDPFERPHIQFNSYDEEDPASDPDLLAMVEGVKRVRAFTERTRARRPQATITEVWPGADVESDEAIAEFVRKESWGHHACCTNPMGADDDERAVLDSDFRVRGAANLRVVDASVFPRIPGTFIALPIFMMSEHAADRIHADALGLP